jgi:hypothetical protein
VLIPGTIIWLAGAVRQRDWPSWLVLAWCAGYITLYLSRLPMYQHGRYIMPVMPVLTLLGVLGLIRYSTSGSGSRFFPPLRLAWQAAAAFLTLGFVLLGARSYAGDVGLIEGEMVVTAKWVDENLPPEAVIAAHDIGALGYFDEHRLLDLAGLISPEVVPFIRDEVRLAEFLEAEGADYLIAFPDFYPVLTDEAEPVFTTGGGFAPEMGGANMVVYRWKRP